jgi:hypothetical protein
MKFLHFYIALVLVIQIVIAKDIKNDYCHITDSKVAYAVITDLIDYIDTTITTAEKEKTCILKNKNLTNYLERYLHLDDQNKSYYSNFRCFDCDKRFKRKDQLYLHYKLFHQSESPYYCPSDFCAFLNCDRYRGYYSIEKHDYSTLPVQKQVKEKHLECNKELVQFYRNSCMKILEDCVPDPKDMFVFYKNFCSRITCGGDGNVLPRDSISWETFNTVMMYLVSFVIFLYLLIIWVNKYS